MKLGYPCINRTIGCTANTTFRLASYSKDRLITTVENNLECLYKTLLWNIENEFFFFRIGSGLVPFASHPVCKFDWKKHFKDDFKKIGDFIKNNNIRISMHPDQFNILNALKEDIIKRSVKEIEYHCDILDLMELDETAKVQIHVGGVYGEKEKAIQRFIDNYKKLPKNIKKRLVIENDDHRFSLKDCLKINKKTEIPIVFDSFHHECINNNESFDKAMKSVKKTWKKKDGIPMIDYSSQKPHGKKRSHIENIDLTHFRKFLDEVKDHDFDMMLEIKNKEESALKALKALKEKKFL